MTSGRWTHDDHDDRVPQDRQGQRSSGPSGDEAYAEDLRARAEKAMNKANQDGNEAPPPRFELVPVSHLLEQPEPLRWLIDGHLLPDSINLLFGDPAAGEAIAIDWAASIATGREWYGHSTTRGQ